METSFTPVASLIGGGLIGLSAVMLMALTGRIAGISGIVSRMLPVGRGESIPGLSVAFVVGLLSAPVLYRIATGAMPLQTVSDNLPLLGIAGVLVGFGSVFGNGCTSGHGVCGLSRLSVRSLVATGAFMLTAAATVYLVRHGGGA